MAGSPQKRRIKPIASALSLIGLLTLPVACGWLNTGGGSWGTDPRPVGSVVASGSLASSNGADFSGSVVVYRSDANQEFILRIESLRINAPSDNSFRLVAEVNGASNFVTTLTVLSGNRNYSTSLFPPNSITRVIIESFTRQPPELATATLTPL